MLDESRRVVAASRRARESLDGLVEGAAVPGRAAARSAGVRRSRSPTSSAAAARRSSTSARRATSPPIRSCGPGSPPPSRTSCARRSPGCSRCWRAPSSPVPTRHELIEQARDEVIRIGELIDDVLFLSELESGRAVVALGSIRALPVIDQVVAEAAERADARRRRAAGRVHRVVRAAAARRGCSRSSSRTWSRTRSATPGTGATCTVSCGEGRRRARAWSSPTTAPASPRRSCRASSSASTGPTTPGRRCGTGSGSRSSSTSSPRPRERSRRPPRPAAG